MDTNSEVNQVIFFDGVCNLCNSSVNFVIDRDPNAFFKFATLQSSVAKELLSETEFSVADLESIIFLSKDSVFCRSRAALEIARQMSGLWPMLYVFILVPGFIRNILYNFIARNRYKWFGKRDACRIPTPELKSRFLES